MHTNNNLIELKTNDGETFIRITHDDDSKTLYLDWTWKYEQGFDYIKTAGQTIIEYITEHKLNKTISDLTKIEGTWDPINLWIIEKWLPAVRKAGATHWVLIQPQEFFAHLAGELMEEGFMLGGLLTHNVRDKREAEEWLKIQES